MNERKTAQYVVRTTKSRKAALLSLTQKHGMSMDDYIAMKLKLDLVARRMGTP